VMRRSSPFRGSLTTHRILLFRPSARGAARSGSANKKPTTFPSLDCTNLRKDAPPTAQDGASLPGETGVPSQPGASVVADEFGAVVVVSIGVTATLEVVGCCTAEGRDVQAATAATARKTAGGLRTLRRNRGAQQASPLLIENKRGPGAWRRRMATSAYCPMRVLLR